MAFENLTTYIEVDSDGDLTVDSTSVIFNTMQRDAVSYVYKDFGAGYFGNFNIDFECEITSVSGDTGFMDICGISNTIGTIQDFVTGDDAIEIVAHSNIGNLGFRISDRSTDNEEDYLDGGTSSNQLYFTFTRSDTTASLYIYSDSGRSSLIDSLNIICEAETKRYFYVLSSRGSTPTDTDSMSGYTQNFEINFNSSSSSSVSSSSLSSSSSSSSSSLSSSSLSSSSSSSSVSSSSVSSSSKSTFPGNLTYIDTDTQGDTYLAVCDDGNFIFTACHLSGVRSYSVDGAGILTYIDTHMQTPGESYRGIWCDGTFIYITSSDDVLSYAVDVSGNLTYKHLTSTLFTGYNDVWGDGNFIYVVALGTGAGLISYTVDAGGNFTLKHKLTSGAGIGVWGDGNFIYTATTGGIRSHTVDGNGILTQKDSDDQGGVYKKIWGDGNFIYVVCDVGVRSYSVDGVGNLSFISNNASGAGNGVWGDGDYIYIAAGGNGVRAFGVDGSGNLTLKDSDDQGGTYSDVWGDGTFVYTTNGGIRSYEVEESVSSSSISSSSTSSSSFSSSSFSSSSTYCLNLSPNRARGGIATASSELPGLNAYEAFDGIVAYWNSWAAAGTDSTPWIKYDFGDGTYRQIEKVRIYGQQQNYPDRVVVHGSFNDSAWVELTDQTMSWPVPTAYQYAEMGFPSLSAWRYVRLSFPDQDFVRASEIELYECFDTTSSSSSSVSNSLSSSSSSLSSSSSSLSSSSSSGTPPSSSSSSSSLSSSSSSFSGSSSSSSSSSSVSSSSLSSSSSSSSSLSSSSSSSSVSSSSSSQSAGQYAYFGYNDLSPYPGDHHGVTLDDDSRVPNLNAATLNVRRNINYIKTGLINFDLKWMADSTSQVVNTFLHLKTTSTVPAGFPISVHEVKKAWTGSQVDWIDRNSSGEWSIVARGALDTDVDTEPVPLDTITPTEASTWYRWDVTQGILDILANQDLTNNRGFILRYPREGGTAVFGETIFHGNDAASDSDKPYVVIALRDYELLSSSSSSSSSSLSISSSSSSSSLSSSTSSSSSSTSSSSSSSLTSSSSSQSDDCVLGWTETAGETVWTTDLGTWDGSKWESQLSGTYQVEISGYTPPAFLTSDPIKVKITLYNEAATGDPEINSIEIWDTNDGQIADLGAGTYALDGDGVSTEITIPIMYYPWETLDKIIIDGGSNNFFVTNVEIYDDCGTAHRITVFSEMGDGDVLNYGSDTWANIRNAATGVEAVQDINGLASQATQFTGYFVVARSFFEFDLSTIDTTESSVDSILLGVVGWGFDDAGAYPTVQEATFSDGATIAVGDYDAFTGPEFVDRYPRWEQFWAPDTLPQMNKFYFNTTGNSYLLSKLGQDSAKFCIREHDHDYADLSPGTSTNYRNGCYFRNAGNTPNTGERYRTPRIVVTYLKTPTYLNAIGPSYWTISNNATWDGTRYTSGSSDLIDLTTAGTWAVGYRPYKISFNFTGATEIYVQLWNTEGSSDLFDGHHVFTNGEEKVIWNYNNYDLNHLEIFNNGSGEFKVHNIQIQQP